MIHKQFIAIIPARGGSKRIPHKNIKKFHGKPIIAYPILAALKSKCYDEVMVSTDDPAIAAVARKYGASVPFFRSPETSNDYAHLAEVIQEVLSMYQQKGYDYKYFCCLLATAPFITPGMLQNSFKTLKQKKVHAVFPVIPFSSPIQRALMFRKNSLVMINPANYTKKSQDFTASYHDSGQFYMVKTSEFIKEKKLFLKKSHGLIIDEMHAQDIDNETDFKLAEMKYSLINKYKL